MRRATFAAVVFALSLLGTLGIAGHAFAAPPGAVISNQAQVSYLNGAGVNSIALSNDVELRTAVIRSPAALLFTRLAAAGDFQEAIGPAYCEQPGNAAVLLNLFDAGGGIIDPTAATGVSPTQAYNLGETLFLRLDDSDQNVDFAVIDIALVTVSHPASGDTETVRLSETEANSGVFAGYLPSQAASAVVGDCVLQGTSGSEVVAAYTDPADSLDSASARALLDPSGRVFDSQTGALVDGTLVRLLDAQSGQPATVFGNDGVSVFPAEIVSGSTVTDGGGTTYSFGEGQFRFPSVPAGQYRLEVDPPGNFAGPSSVLPADLQALPTAPFVLGPQSFSNEFSFDGNGPLAFDYPVDPQESALFLRKSTRTSIASPGDFVRYELQLENTSDSDTASGVRVTDFLPAGTRYVPGTATLAESTIADPEINPNHSQLIFDIGNLSGGGDASISYVLEIVGGQRNDRTG